MEGTSFIKFNRFITREGGGAVESASPQGHLYIKVCFMWFIRNIRESTAEGSYTI